MLTLVTGLTGQLWRALKQVTVSSGTSVKHYRDLVTENHYDHLTEILKERGMARYTESHESGRAFIGDGMEVKRKAAIPMSATWTPGGLDRGPKLQPAIRLMYASQPQWPISTDRTWWLLNR